MSADRNHCGPIVLAARRTKAMRGWFLQAILLLSFVAQGTIVQTHVDFARAAVPAANGVAATMLLPAGKTGEDGKSTVCPLCQEAAMAGHYFMPAAGALPSAPAVFGWIEPFGVSAFALGVQPHGWLSRAPPE